MLEVHSLPDELELVTRDGAVGLRVRAKPGARHSAILGVGEGALIVALAAPPREGLANKELVNLFARLANIPKSRVELVSGAAGRYKLVRIHGVEPDQLRALLLNRS